MTKPTQQPIVDPHPLEPQFARYVAFYAATHPLLMARVGSALEVDRVPTDDARKLLLKGAALVWRETGHGPSKGVITLQRIRALVDDGRVTQDELRAAADALEEDEDSLGRPSADEVLALLVPILRKDMERQAADAADEAWAKSLPMDKAERLIQRSRTLGVVDESIGYAIDDAERLIDDVSRLPRMPVGVADIDLATKGGLRRGCVGMWLGSTGHGKSIALCHVAAMGLRMGMDVCYATVGAEVTPADVWARVAANVTGATIDDVFATSARYVNELRHRVGGHLAVQEFAGGVTTWPDVATWIDRVEQKRGKKIGLMVLDYLGKLGSHTKGGRKSTKDESGYEAGKTVVEAVCGWTKEHDCYQWTADQGQRRKDSKKLLDTDDVADSLGKSRSVDLEVSVNFDKEAQEVTFLVCKDRHGGGAGTKVGPVPADYARSRLTVMSDESLRYADRWIKQLTGLRGEEP